MFEDNDILQPQRQVQRVGDWFEQRKQFRAQALTALRKREGLPGPVDETGTPLETRFDDLGNVHYYDAQGNKVEHVLFAGAGKDGKPGGFAIGKRKQESETLIDEHGVERKVPTSNTASGWGRVTEFEIMEVAEDGTLLKDELRDLARDATGMQMAEKVSHGTQSQMVPDLALSSLSDEEVDASLQEYLKRGPNGNSKA